MKSLLIIFLLSGGLAGSAAAQAGWGSANSWDAPKKKTVKKTPAPTRQAAAASQDKALQNNGAAPAPEAPVLSPASAAVAPTAGSGFGGGSSPAPMGTGMSAAPGTPIMMSSGRNVLRDDAIAARERRMLHRAGKPAAATPVPAPIAVPATAPLSARPSGTTTGATGAGNVAGGQDAAPAIKSAAAQPAAPKPARAPKKAPAAPAGW